MERPDRLRAAVYAVALALMVGWLLHVGRGLLTPIVAAVLAVFVISGLSAQLARMPRLASLPGWGRDLLATAIICFVIVEMVVLIAGNLGAVAARAPAYEGALLDLYSRVAVLLDLDEAASLEALRAEAARLLNVPAFLRALAGTVAALLAVLVFVLLNVGFLMVEREDFAHKLTRLGRVQAVIGDVNARVGTYLALQTGINVALGLASWAIMRAFGVEFAVIFAVVIAALNYIPYFGSIIGVAFPVAAALVQFPEPSTAVWLAIWLAGAQFFFGNIVAPRLMGESLNLSPWVILVGLTFWTSLWGVAGALFSVPILAVMVVVFSEFDGTRPIAVMMSRRGELGGPAR